MIQANGIQANWIQANWIQAGRMRVKVNLTVTHSSEGDFLMKDDDEGI